MHIGTFDITVNTFRSLGGVVPIDADMTLDPSSDRVFSLDGDNIGITLPKDDHEAIHIVFKLHDPELLLIGIAFSNGKKGLADSEFPVVVLEPDPVSNRAPNGAYRKMTIQDAGKVRTASFSYSFVILVQKLSTGEVGIIDPGVQGGNSP